MTTGQQALELIKETLEGQESRIAELEAEKAALEAEIKRLKGVESADDFVGRLMKATKLIFRVKRQQADCVRLVLLNLGRVEEQQELADWMDKQQKRGGVKKVVQHNVNSQVFNGEVTESEFNGKGGNNGKRKAEKKHHQSF